MTDNNNYRKKLDTHRSESGRPRLDSEKILILDVRLDNIKESLDQTNRLTNLVCDKLATTRETFEVRTDNLVSKLELELKQEIKEAIDDLRREIGEVKESHMWTNRFMVGVIVSTIGSLAAALAALLGAG